METNKEIKMPTWVKVKKGDEFTEDVFFATHEDLVEKGRYSNMLYGKGCHATEDGYILSRESLTKIPIEQ